MGILRDESEIPSHFITKKRVLSHHFIARESNGNVCCTISEI